jgi:hypothetical protein
MSYRKKPTGLFIKPRKVINNPQQVLTKTFCSKIYYELPNNVKMQLIQQIRTTGFKRRIFNTLNENNMKNINADFLIQIDIKNGMDFQLFFTTLNGKKYSIFIHEHRNNLILYNVKFRVSDDLYNGTFFSGKIGKTKKGFWIYTMNDVCLYKGRYVQKYSLQDKLNMMYKFIREDYVFDEYINTCILQLASFCPLNHMNFIKKDCRLLFISNKNYDNYYSDVCINKREEEEIKTESIFKVVKTETSDVYTLYDGDNYVGVLCVNSLECSKKLNEIFEDISEKKMNCKYSEFFKSWTIDF